MRWLAMAVLALSLGGCGIFGKKSSLIQVPESTTTTIGVNGYLWQASLDALAKLPLAQADANAGIITTDWFVDPTVPTERLKVTVHISDRRLRADAIRVSVSRQELTEGVWVNVAVQAGTERKIEDTILNRARNLWILRIDRG
ncbi:MAG TPA: DUF3576 domain-containing protein [Sphingomonadales bacterium]|nr:DUF3576 domain-containing protein [Sphingomonadales bacterium]